LHVSDISGLVDPVHYTEVSLDEKPYSVLFYGNGPGYNDTRVNLTGVDMSM